MVSSWLQSISASNLKLRLGFAKQKRGFDGGVSVSYVAWNRDVVLLTFHDRSSTAMIVAQKKAKKTRKIYTERGSLGAWEEGAASCGEGWLLPSYLFRLGKTQLVTPLLLKEMKIEEERIEAEKKRVKEEAEQLALLVQTVGEFKVKRKDGKGKLIFGT